MTTKNLIVTTPRTSCIYFKPKIHKPNNPGRPIVSACSCPTELISSYLDRIKVPIVKSLPSYIKDTNHALEIFRDFNFSGENKLIFTMDITSLYTVIPNNEGLQELRFFFDQRTVKEPSSEALLRLAELVLILNCFSFADNHYKQVNGVAMGITMGPSYANLFVGYIEYQFFNQFNGTKPELYRRYIDDCIGATLSSREELDHFITSVNSFHPALKYTWEISEISIAFLDIKVSINGNGLSTSYLLHSSSHPSHLNFLDFGVYVVMTPIFPTNQRKCVISSRIVAILILLSTQLNTVLLHCKRHRRKRMREFHLHSLTIMSVSGGQLNDDTHFLHCTTQNQ